MARAARKKTIAASAAEKPLEAPSDLQTPKPKRRQKQVVLTAKHRELQHRPTLTGWTPENVEAARGAADQGQMQQLADLVETIVRDDRVTGVLSTRTYGLLGLQCDFVGGDDEARARLKGAGDDQPGEWSAMFDESELAKLQTWGLMCGVGLAQRIPLPRVLGEPFRYRIETWSPRWLTYYHYPPSDWSHWRLMTTDGQINVIPGVGEWIIYTPYGARRPWASGLWNAVAFPWLLKHFALEDRANLSEVLGQPIWVGTTKHTATEAQRKDFLSRLGNLGKQGKLVLPEGWDFQLKEASGVSWENFARSVEWCDSALSIALAGQTVTTEGSGGFSNNNIFDSIKADFIRFDAERLSTCCKVQALDPWALVNYGSTSAAPWPRWNVKRPIDMEKKGTTIAQLGKAIGDLDTSLKPHGLQVDAEQLLQEYDIPYTKLGATNDIA